MVGVLLVFLGIEDNDSTEDIEWLSSKIINLRIFNDDDGVMNVSLKDIFGDILLVSQFTLHASIKKGNRPSYLKASKPGISKLRQNVLYRGVLDGLSAYMSPLDYSKKSGSKRVHIASKRPHLPKTCSGYS